MIIPIGFWGGGGKADYELIGTVYGTGASGTIDFQSLSGLASKYKHLQIRATMRTTGASGELLLQFNNVTSGPAYSFHRLMGSGASTPTSDGYANNGSIYSYPSAWSSATTNMHGVMVMDILDAFNTSKYKTVRSFSGYWGSNGQVALNSGSFNSTSAIDSIQLKANATNWGTTSRFSLYGIKG